MEHIKFLKGDAEYNLPSDTQVLNYYLSSLPKAYGSHAMDQGGAGTKGHNKTLDTAQAYYIKYEDLRLQNNMSRPEENYKIPKAFSHLGESRVKPAVEVNALTSNINATSSKASGEITGNNNSKESSSSNNGNGNNRSSKKGNGKYKNQKSHKSSDRNPKEHLTDVSNVPCTFYNITTGTGCARGNRCRYKHGNTPGRISGNPNSNNNSNGNRQKDPLIPTGGDRHLRLCRAIKQGKTCKFGADCWYSHDKSQFNVNVLSKGDIAREAASSSSATSATMAISHQPHANQASVPYVANSVPSYPSQAFHHHVAQMTIGGEQMETRVIDGQLYRKVNVLTVNQGVLTSSYPTRKVILDTGAQIHCTNGDDDRRKVTQVTAIVCNGVSSTQAISTAVTSPMFSDPFYIIKDSRMDIISMGLARKDYTICVSSDANTIVLTHKRQAHWVLTFKLEDNLYVLDRNSMTMLEKDIAVIAHEEHVNAITRIQQVPPGYKRTSWNSRPYQEGSIPAKIHIYHQLHQALHHPSDSSLKAFLKSEWTKLFPLKADEVDECRAHLGECMECSLGKAKTRLNPLHIVGVPPTRIGEKVVSDIFTIGKHLFIGFWDCYSNMGFIYPVAAKTLLLEATREVMNEFAKAHHGISKIVSDHEIIYTSLAGLAPIQVQQRAPGTHEHAAERHIQLLQQRLRAAMASLIYTLPDNLLPYAVVDIQNTLNYMPTRNHKTPPYSVFYGLPVVYNGHVQLKFGAAVMVNIPINQLNNRPATTPRALPAIVIGRDNGSPGLLRMYTTNSTHVSGYAMYELTSTFDIMRLFGVNTFRGNPSAFNHLFNSHPIQDSEPVMAEGVETNDISMSTNSASNGNRDNSAADNVGIMKAGHDTSSMVTGPPPIAEEDDAQTTEMVSEHTDLHSSTDNNIISGQDVEPTIPENDDGQSQSTYGDAVGTSASTPGTGQPNVQRPHAPSPDNSGDLEQTSDDQPDSTSIIAKPGKRSLPENYEEVLRRSTRVRSKVIRLLTVQALDQFIVDVANLTIDEAMAKHPDASAEAIVAELQQMVDLKVWSYVKHNDISLYQNGVSKPIPSRLFIKEKISANGIFEKIKARLVAGGHKQGKGSAAETYAPTADAATILIVLSVAIREARFIRTYDIKGAYLHASLSGDKVYMRLDARVADFLVKADPLAKQYRHANGTILVTLDKALYGLIQSANLWYKLIKSTLEENGYVNKELSDRCLFIKNTNHGMIHVTVTVDDVLATSTRESDLDDLQAILTHKFQKIVTNKVTDNDFHLNHLGIHINYNRLQGVVELSQPHYIDKLLSDNKITTGKSYPMLPETLNHKDDTPACDVDTYRSEIYRVMYLATRTRPDILFACSLLATRVLKPTMRDWNAYLHILQYLYTTKHLCLTFRQGTMSVSSYIDAAYNMHEDAKSHSGAACFVNDSSGAISSKSTKQKTTADSSCAAEIIALSTYAKQAIWFKGVLNALGCQVEKIIIHQDNQSTIQLANNGPTARGKSKWMDVRYFSVKELVDTGMIKIQYCPTREQLADILTKPLTGAQFIVLRDRLLGISA